MKVAKNQQMKVLESSPKYKVLDTPDKRARNNLYIEYEIKYATTQNGSATKGHKECIYYEISRCGDGILDTNYDEICDPADPNQVGWWNGWCNDSCQPVTKVEEPECNSDYNGQTVTELVWWDYLCNKWTITWFKYNELTHTWTWRCENSEGKWVNCSANKPYDWTLLIDKSLVWSKEIKNTWDLITWNIRVTATWWDVTDFVVTDHLPSILWYSGYEITHNPWLTVSTPTLTWDDVIWDVKWTLKAWEYLEIRLTTYAKEMPRVDFTNVACVRENPNDPEKCDQVDIPVDWTLLIDKSLVWSKEIKNTWDLITWNIRVTATWWDVTDFVVTDHLPSILWYSGYEITHNPWLTVSTPTLTWDDVIWDVKWTLKAWEYLEIRLTTYAKEMPRVDFTNVACVRENPNDPEKCDQVDIPVDWTLLIDKTLVWEREVKEVGDLITWNIKVTATWWNVTDFIVIDHLPRVLDYVSYSIVNNPWLTVSEPVVSWKNIEWDVKWTLQEWKSLEISVVTSVTEMPKIDYENVACVRENPNDPEKCDKEDLPVMKVRIVKTFTDGTKVKTVGIWDTIAYKVSFGNSGTASASITSLKDFLPKNVSYVSSEIFINGQSVHSEVVSWSEIINSGTRVDGVYIDIYSWITLNPWDNGYIILTWKVLSDNQDSRTNFACIYVNDEKIDCDDARHDITTTLACTAPVIDTKSFTKAGWTTNVVCKTAPAWEKANSIELDCGNGTTYTWSNISELSWSCTYPANSSSSSRSYSVVCKVNGDTADNCKWTVSVAGGWNPPSGEDPHCKAPEIVNSWDYIKEVTCKTDNGDDYLIWVTCFDEDTIHISSWKVSSFTYACKYDKAGNYNIQCYVPKYKNADTVTKDDTKPNQCGTWAQVSYLCKSVKVNPESGTSKTRQVTCETTLPANEVESIAIYCNYDNDKNTAAKTGSKVSSLTWECTYSSNWTYKVQCVVNWKVENSCEATAKKTSGWGGWWWGGRKETVYVTGMSCFNVNAWNVSIEKWEILPFYWNIEKLSESVKEWIYVEYDTWTYKYGNNNYNSMYGKSCNEKETIALNSMLCSFKITNWDWKIVSSWTYPCLSDEAKNIANKPLIERWINWMEDKYGVNSKWEKVVWSLDPYGKPMWNLWYVFRSNIQYITGFASNETTLWEYKITLTQVDYLYCDEDKKWEKWEPYKSVCESNFMVSDSYTVQKTPSGNLTASTEKLSNYVYMDWTSTFKASELLNAISATDYKANKEIEGAMDKFIKKYEKLAVEVKSNSFNWKNLTVKKVPWKNIYFISWDEIGFSGGKNAKITKPFTIVQTNPGKTITIDGDLQYNMMLLTRWDIVFKWNCTSDQEVKWIFYSERNILRAWVWKNKDINSSVWCTNWWLHVKWVLIWGGRNNLMDKSRSNLNGWFGTYWNKKSIVMNWASVLIEYSPSVFTKSTMPPGAEDFTTALTVYKN